MRKYQGFSVIFFMVGTFLVCFFGLFAFKALPYYIEHYYVKQALYALASEDLNVTTIRTDVQKSLSQKFDIDSVTSVRARDVIIERAAGGYRIKLEYDVRVPISDHISFTLSFRDSAMVERHVR